jgi:hypothetical protein
MANVQETPSQELGPTTCHGESAPLILTTNHKPLHLSCLTMWYLAQSQSAGVLFGGTESKSFKVSLYNEQFLWGL